jgi:hypothetical protein
MQSGSPRVVQLTLVLAETLVKNGSATLHAQIGSRAFLQEISAVTDGSKGFDVQNKALELIKQWADAFAGSSLTTFQDTYRMLKIHGVVFPEIENDVPVFTPPPTTPSSQSRSMQETVHSNSSRSMTSTGSSSALGRSATRDQQVAKLHADLKVVMEKITIYRELKAAGQRTSEEMEDVLDFLRQCQPRMNTLIEGGITGKLDERTLEECLNVNDHLIKVLEDAKSSASQQEDMMRFDSPKRSAQPDLLGDMSALSLGGDAASAHGSAVPPLRTAANATGDGA